MNNYGNIGGGFSMDGGGGFGGGGSSQEGAAKRSTSNTLRPVTIKQILEASQAHPDAEFVLDGSETGSVTFVAAVRNMSQQNTNITYRMEDGTGLVEVKQWLDPERGDMDGAKRGISIDTYVRVTGQLKSFNGKRHVGCHHIRPITDSNEIIYHMLEAAAVHLYFIKGPPTSANGKTEDGTTNPFSIETNQQRYGNLPPTQRKIMEVIDQQPHSVEGVHIQVIAKALGVQDLTKDIDALYLGGLIYTTIDDDHVASSHAMM